MKQLASPNPHRLKEARVARGLSIAELAENLGISRQAVSQFELGQATPKGETMFRLTQTLQLPLSFFFAPSEHSVDEQSATFFRSLKSSTKRSRDMVLVRATWMWRIFKFLEEYVDFPRVNIPKVVDDTPPEDLSLSDIESLAKQVRVAWGLGLGPISNVTMLFEQNGILISKGYFEDMKLDAYSQWRSIRPLIFLASDKFSASRNRFNAAHELGHILLHADIDAAQLTDPKVFHRIESQANAFAGAFLLPEESFCNEVMSSSLMHFVSLKERWKVSIAAMIYRCEQLGVLTDNQALYLRKQMAIKKMRTIEPLDKEIEPESPKMLGQAVRLLIDHGVVSVSVLSESVKLPLSEIEDLCNLPSGSLSRLAETNVVPMRIKQADGDEQVDHSC